MSGLIEKEDVGYCTSENTILLLELNLPATRVTRRLEQSGGDRLGLPLVWISSGAGVARYA